MKTVASKETQKAMQQALDNLGIPLSVAWVPDARHNNHGAIKGSTLFIYDQDQDQAWETFTHEIFEYKLKEVTRCYRLIINSLIEALEKVAYARKEDFLEFLPRVFRSVEEAKHNEETQKP